MDEDDDFIHTLMEMVNLIMLDTLIIMTMSE